MDLFEEIFTSDIVENPVLEVRGKKEPPKVNYEKLIVDEPPSQNLSSLTQLMLAPFILVNSNGVWDIPIFYNDIQDIVFQEIAPHFYTFKKVTIDDQVSLRLQNIKESSKRLFINQIENYRLNAIVIDIYSKGAKSIEGNFPIKEYKVNLEVVGKSTDNDVLSIWDFVFRSFVKDNGKFVILPIGWVFDESFKERVAVQSFASVCNSMIVIVNQKNNMISSVLLD